MGAKARRPASLKTRKLLSDKRNFSQRHNKWDLLSFCPCGRAFYFCTLPAFPDYSHCQCQKQNGRPVLTMEDVVKSSVSTEATSWNSRTEAAPLRRAPLLLTFICFSSPANKLTLITLRALGATWVTALKPQSSVKYSFHRGAKHMVPACYMHSDCLLVRLESLKGYSQGCLLKQNASNDNVLEFCHTFQMELENWPEDFEPSQVKAAKLEGDIGSMQQASFQQWRKEGKQIQNIPKPNDHAQLELSFLVQTLPLRYFIIHLKPMIQINSA